MTKNKFTSKNEKALYAIYLLDKEKSIITREDLSVKLWDLYKTEFCMVGYPQYPNNDIQKYLTKLFTDNLIKGGVSSYKITDKGKKLVLHIINSDKLDNKKLSDVNTMISRELQEEIIRIKSSSTYNYYISESNPQLSQQDFFNFLGISARSLHDNSNAHSKSKINLIKYDLIKYCKYNKDKDEVLKNILDLWDKLSSEFGRFIENG